MDENTEDNAPSETPKISAARAAVERFNSDPQRVAEWEAQLQRAAQRLEDQLGHIPFYAERAKGNPNYWRNMAASAPYF